MINKLDFCIETLRSNKEQTLYQDRFPVKAGSDKSGRFPKGSKTKTCMACKGTGKLTRKTLQAAEGGEVKCSVCKGRGKLIKKILAR